MQRQPLFTHDAKILKETPTANVPRDRKREPDQRHNATESHDDSGDERAHLSERTIRLPQKRQQEFFHVLLSSENAIRSMWRTT
jgi:hypothetical protein